MEKHDLLHWMRRPRSTLTLYQQSPNERSAFATVHMISFEGTGVCRGTVVRVRVASVG